MITLYQSVPAWGLPDLSPFCVKVETYLRMAELPFRTEKADLRKAPKGKMPWIEDKGRRISDSSDIIAYLKATYGDPLDRGSSEDAHALGHTVQRMLEEHTYFALVYARWVDPAGTSVYKTIFVREILPPVIGGPIFSLICRNVARMLKAQGIGRHTPDEIYARGVQDIEALSRLLGDKPYLLGDQPSSYDATVYAFVSGLYLPPIETPLKRRIASLPNLVAYVERMRSRYFGA